MEKAKTEFLKKLDELKKVGVEIRNTKEMQMDYVGEVLFDIDLTNIKQILTHLKLNENLTIERTMGRITFHENDENDLELKIYFNEDKSLVVTGVWNYSLNLWFLDFESDI